MSFNPNLPASHSPLDSAEMRGQLNALNALIDAAPGITAAQVDAVNTVAAGQPANVSLGLVAGVLHVSCDIPQGSDGAPGPQGPPGPSVATAIVDGVSTLSPGSNATVAVGFDGSNVHFTFGIPSGANGNDGGTGGQGPKGDDGTPGPAGPTGAQGEVGAQQFTDGLASTLATATANSSANTNSVPMLDTPFADPDAEAIRLALNTLISTLRR